MKHTAENLRAVLDFMRARPKLKPAMRSIGCDEGLIFDWMRKSANGDPGFLVDWPEGDTPRQFVEQIKIARQQNIISLDAQFRDEVEHGIERVVVKDGIVMYRVDPQLAADALDPEKWVMLHGKHRPITDIYARDFGGALVPLTITEPVPAHQKIKAITSLIPSVYGEKREISVTTHQGPLILPRDGDAPPVQRVIEQRPEETLLAPEPAPDSEQAPRMVVGRAAKTSAEMDQWKADGEFEHHAVEVQRPDGTIDNVTAGSPNAKSLEELMPLSKGKALTPLQEELLRLANAKPANPHPHGVVEKFSADDTELHDQVTGIVRTRPLRPPVPGSSAVAHKGEVPTRADQATRGSGILPGGFKVS